MTTFTERFDEMLDFIGITAYKLAKEIGSSDAVISSIRSGKTKPSFEFLSKLLSKYEVININYLITGTGKIAPKNDNSGGDNSQKDTTTTLKHTKVPPTEQANASPNARNLQDHSSDLSYKTTPQPAHFLHEPSPKYGTHAPAKESIYDLDIPARIALLERNQKKIMKKLGIK